MLEALARAAESVGNHFKFVGAISDSHCRHTTCFKFVGATCISDRYFSHTIKFITAVSPCYSSTQTHFQVLSLANVRHLSYEPSLDMSAPTRA